MAETPTEKEINEFVFWAKGSCLCESYYSYQCFKCRAVADGYLQENKVVLDYCLDKGLVAWNSYHILR